MKNTAKKLIGITLILTFLGVSCVCAAGDVDVKQNGQSGGNAAPAGEEYTLGNDKITSITTVVGQRNVVKSDTVTNSGVTTMTVEYSTDPNDHTQAANDMAKYFKYLMANNDFSALKSFSYLPYEGGVEMCFAKDSVDKGKVVILDIDYNIKGYTLKFQKKNGKLTPNDPSDGIAAASKEYYTLGNDKITSITKVVGQRNVVTSDTVTTSGVTTMTAVYSTDPNDHTQAANDVAKYFQYLMANENFLSLKPVSGLPYEGGVEMSFAIDSVDKGEIIILNIDYNTKGYTLKFKKSPGKLTRK